MKIPDEIKNYMTNDSGYCLVHIDQRGIAGKSFRIKNGKISRIRLENKTKHGKVGSTDHDHNHDHNNGKPDQKVPMEHTHTGYVGEWRDGLKHGQGKWTYRKGSIKEIYVCKWKARNMAKEK